MVFASVPHGCRWVGRVRDGGGEGEAKPGAGAGVGVMALVSSPVAELDGDEIGFLVGKVAEIKRQK